MKWIGLMLCALLLGTTSLAKEGEPQQLYAQSAVLMDADSGRVLFEKNGMDIMPMASTTKIMTCILALEYMEADAIVEITKNAASQPKVHLGVGQGERYYLKDLLYSLMLESHNDAAVAIAEGVAGSVEAFARMMNEKAEELGCEHTHFITPNGLDAEDEYGVHSTTARELARIMKYCIMESSKREKFLEITQTTSYGFTDVSGKRSYQCYNHNAFLNMMEGALTGKTGFTSAAGYCYVGALRKGGKTLISVVLACGWPNHKTYKWQDTKQLMQYGLDYYDSQEFSVVSLPETVRVNHGVPKGDRLFEVASVKIAAGKEGEGQDQILMHKEEEMVCEMKIKSSLEAPVTEGEQVGILTYRIDGEIVKQTPILVTESIEKKTFAWYWERMMEWYICF